MADKWTYMIAGSGLVIVVFRMVVLVYAPPTPQETWRTSGFPYCLRVLQCANVPEFAGIPFDQMIIIAKNYDACFEDYKIEQTCNVQVSQDIERFHELGYVTRR